MIDKALYRKLRDDNWRPADAARQARTAPPTIKNVDDDAITLDVQGWDVRVTAEHDTDYDPELGAFTDTWAEGAFHLGQSSPWRYFLPQTTAEEHRRGLSRSGFARHEADCLARSYVRSDMLQQLGVIYQPWIVTVITSLEGVDFGFAAIGGVTFDEHGIKTDEVVEYVTTSGLLADSIGMAAEKLTEVRRAATRLHLVR